MAFLFYFDDMNFLIVNGELIKKGRAYLSPDNHSYRYGDGLFETMKMIKGDLVFEKYHFERLLSGCKLLKFSVPAHFTVQKISDAIKTLCKKNDCEESARVRLSVSRGNGGLYDCDNNFFYLIECWPLEKNRDNLNKNGLIIDVFPDARKSIDIFSNLKSANCQPYVMAAIWAKENKLNEALILNQHNRICEATIANVFWIKNNMFYTPHLNEGCVAGVMRKKILDLKLNVNETILTENDLLNADEVFLTNVITGIRWVKQCGNKDYHNNITSKVFAEMNRTIYS